jgi:programmed cell death 8 (apoptosis-inducing factor)
LGSELACALAHMSKKYGGNVIQIFPEEGNLRRILPQYLSEWTTKRVKEGILKSNALLMKTSVYF